MAWKERARRKLKIDTGIQYCRDLVADPTPDTQDASFKACLLRWLDQSDKSSPATAPPTELAACLAGKAYAPDEETAAEFEQWCYAQTWGRRRESRVISSNIQGSIPASELLLFRVPDEEKLPSPMTPTALDDWMKYFNLFPTDQVPAKIEWAAEAIHLDKIVNGKIYAYNHLRSVLKCILTSREYIFDHHLFNFDTVLVSQLGAMPSMFLLFIDGIPTNSRDKIIVVDPVGQRDPIASRYVKNFFIPDFPLLLKVFIQEVKGDAIQGIESIDLAAYEIKVAISHSHPDHWTGLPILIEQLMPRQVEVLLPNQQAYAILKDFTNVCIAEENKCIMSQLGWSASFINQVRKMCDLFYGKPTEIEEGLLERIKFTCVNNTYLLGEFNFQVHQGVHCGAVMLFAYKTHRFLDDLFLPAFSLSTCFPPFASYEVLRTIFLDLPETASVFWNHYFRDPSQAPYKQPIPYREVDDEFLNLRKSVWKLSQIYSILRKKSITSTKKEIFQQVFKLVTNLKEKEQYDFLEELLEKCLHLELEKVGSTLVTFSNLLEYINCPEIHIYPIVEAGPARSLIPHLYTKISRIGIETSEGGISAPLDPKEVQYAILLITFLINLLSFCEAQYDRRILIGRSPNNNGGEENTEI